MKIGILTYPLNNNYGCYLQSYALLHFLQEKGYDVEYIMRRHDKPSWKVYLKYAVKTIFLNILDLTWNSPIYNYEWHYMLKKGAKLYPFFESHIIPHTKPLYTTKSLAEKCKEYDAIIVGSDQIWRAEILSNVEDYFLGFLRDPNIAKISYAASFGKEMPGFSKKQLESCGIALSLFKAVSVREEVGLKLITDYGWKCRDSKVVLDPTMLLSKEEYMAMAKINKSSVVFVYILDETNMKFTVANRIADELTLDKVSVLSGVNNSDFVYPSIEYWLSGLASASFVVTDSFHGVVFSILFNVSFAVILNKERGAARFETILKTFGLEDRVLTDEKDVSNILNNRIDWERVNNILNLKREESSLFLLSNLGRHV